MMRWLSGLTMAALLGGSASAYAQATFPDEPAPPAPAPPPAATPAPPPAATPAPPPAATPAPPPAATPAPPPAATPAPPPAAGLVPPLSEPPLPPAPASSRGPIREARPFFIGGELGWNGLAGLGVNFSYHPLPYVALDAGAGLALTGFRFGVRARANFLTGEWTPTLGAGFTDSTGIEDDVPLMVRGEEVTIEVLSSSYVQLVGGVNYTGREGFVFTGLLGYAFLLQSPNTRYVAGAMDRYEEAREIYAGGLVISLAFGYAF